MADDEVKYSQSFNKPEERVNRRTLRKNGTSAEASMWLLLKNRQLDGWRWRRQFSVGSYILDFYCPEAKLAVELDGNPHFRQDGSDRDFVRDLVLWRDYGIKVLRFENKTFWRSQESVLDTIRSELNKT